MTRIRLAQSEDSGKSQHYLMKDLDGTSRMSQMIFSIQITFSVWLQKM